MPESLLTALQKLVRWLRQQDLILLIGVLLMTLLSYVFIVLADEVMEQEAISIDDHILLALRTQGDLDDPIGPLWLEEAGVDLTALGSWPVVSLTVMLALGLLVFERRWRATGVVVASVGGGSLLVDVLKSAFARPRPEVVPHMVQVLSESFPSGHATIAAVTYATLGALATQLAQRRAVKLYLLAASLFVAVLVGLTRVYLGVHYPTDVVAGWCLGFAWATLCVLVTRVLIRRGALREDQQSLRS